MREKSRGMTIIEVMISLTIVTMMIGLVTGALANYLRMTAAVRNTVEIVGQHEKILRMIRSEMEQSSANRFQKQWWIEGGETTLRFKKLSGFVVDAGGNPSMSWSSDIAYGLDAEGFVTRTQNGVTEKIAGNVTELRFTEIDNGRVRINLTNERGNLERNTRTVLSTAAEVTPRN